MNRYNLGTELFVFFQIVGIQVVFKKKKVTDIYNILLQQFKNKWVKQNKCQILKNKTPKYKQPIWFEVLS